MSEQYKMCDVGYKRSAEELDDKLEMETGCRFGMDEEDCRGEHPDCARNHN